MCVLWPKGEAGPQGLSTAAPEGEQNCPKEGCGHPWPSEAVCREGILPGSPGSLKCLLRTRQQGTGLCFLLGSPHTQPEPHGGPGNCQPAFWFAFIPFILTDLLSWLTEGPGEAVVMRLKRKQNRPESYLQGPRGQLSPSQWRGLSLVSAWPAPKFRNGRESRHSG